MNARAAPAAADGVSEHGTYFFLSYAHTPPVVYEAAQLEWSSNADDTVSLFFDELSTAVRAETSPAPPRRPALDTGFCDRTLRSGADWTAEVDAAIGRAQVFVALYSPRYFASSWAGREWGRFVRRLRGQGVADPEQRIVPVLWTPLPPGFHNPTGVEVPEEHARIPGYREDGLQALRRLTRRKPQYDQAVKAVAATIVRIAEEHRIGPGAVLPDDGEPAFPAEDADSRLALLVAAPGSGRDDAVRAWRPFGERQRLSLADYAETAAARFGFACRARALTEKADGLESAPGVVLIDTRLGDDPAGRGLVEAALSNLPPWAVVALVAPRGTADGGPGRWLRQYAAARNGDLPRHAVSQFATLEAFDRAFPILVTDAARLYLKLGPAKARNGGASTRPYIGQPPPD